MGKETKVGLGVIAILLAIFIAVLVYKFRDRGEPEVAAAGTTAKSAATTSKSKSEAKTAPQITAPKKSVASTWSSNREQIRPVGEKPKPTEPPKFDNPFRAPPAAAPAANATAQSPARQPSTASNPPNLSLSAPEQTPKQPAQAKAEPALVLNNPFTGPPATTPQTPAAQTFSPFQAAPAAMTSAPPARNTVSTPPAAVASDSLPDATMSGLAAAQAYDTAGPSNIAPAESATASSRRAPALLMQPAETKDAAIEPVAAEGYNPPATMGGGQFSAQRNTPGGSRQAMPNTVRQAQPAPPAAPLHSRSTAGDLSQADAYNPAGHDATGGHIDNGPQRYDPPGRYPMPDRSSFGHTPAPPQLNHEPTQPLGPDRRYVVQPNDNYWSISEKVFGTGAYFKAILQHQRDRGRAIEEHLQPGEVLTIPPSELLARDYPHLCPRQAPRSTAASQPMMQVSAPRRALNGGRGMVYVVEEGDTLFDIARYELGKATRWAEIYELNRDQIGDDFHHLKPGTQLVLPSQDAGESVTRTPSRVLQR